MAEKALENETRVRPLFLTILCILSFLNCAWILYNGLSHMGESTPDLIKQNALITTIGGIFSVIGTALIWNMRQFGFGLFFAGTVFAIAGPIIIYGVQHVLSFNTGYPAYISFGLLILFATHYKQLD